MYCASEAYIQKCASLNTHTYTYMRHNHPIVQEAIKRNFGNRRFGRTCRYHMPKFGYARINDKKVYVVPALGGVRGASKKRFMLIPWGCFGAPLGVPQGFLGAPWERMTARDSKVCCLSLSLGSLGGPWGVPGGPWGSLGIPGVLGSWRSQGVPGGPKGQKVQTEISKMVRNGLRELQMG